MSVIVNYLRTRLLSPHMRSLLTFTASLSLVASCAGQVNPNYHWVGSYTTRDGRYVPGHYSTDPNETNRDNYSTYPNINPHTGEQGTVRPDNNGTGVQQFWSSGGDPIWVASSGQVPLGAMMQRQRILTPAERAARDAARQARKERAAAHRASAHRAAQVRAEQRRADSALRKMRRDAERAARKSRRSLR